MPNIRILVLAVFPDILNTRLFLYKMPMSEKKRITQPKIYGIGSKVNQFIYTLVCIYMRNIRILAKAVFRYFVHKVLPIQNANVRKRGITRPKSDGIGSKVNQFIYILVCNYMPNIRILALAVLQIFCSQGCSYIVEKGA